MVDKTNGQNEEDEDLCLFIMIFCACIATSVHYYDYHGRMTWTVHSTHRMAQNCEIPNGKMRCQMIKTKWKSFSRSHKVHTKWTEWVSVKLIVCH